MKKENRVRSRRDFVKISKSGLCYRTAVVVAQCSPTELPLYRVGFTASRRVGNAVVRNRCKRRMRAAADEILKDSGMPGVDYVFIAKKSTYDADWELLLESIRVSVEFLNRKLHKCKK